MLAPKTRGHFVWGKKNQNYVSLMKGPSSKEGVFKEQNLREATQSRKLHVWLVYVKQHKI